MDRIADLQTIVQQVVSDYATPAIKATTYFTHDPQKQVYTVISVPDQPRQFRAGIVVMARIEGDSVIIDEDITDRPLVDALIEAGVAREKITLAYRLLVKEST